MQRVFLSKALALIIILLGTAIWSFCGQANARSTADSEAIKSFLREYLKGPTGVADKATRYLAASVNLNDGGKEQVIVYFTDQNSCGSGGSQTLILDSQGSSFRVVTSLSIGGPPIRVLDTR